MNYSSKLEGFHLRAGCEVELVGETSIQLEILASQIRGDNGRCFGPQSQCSKIGDFHIFLSGGFKLAFVPAAVGADEDTDPAGRCSF